MSATPAEEEVLRLRAALEDREAACIRQEGEKYLLAAQVQQLEQQAMYMSRDATMAFAQLAQALQLLDAGSGMRAPLKPEADRARALVAGARRGLRRLTAGGPGLEEHRASDAASMASSAARSAGAAHGRRSAPRGRPRSPTAPVPRPSAEAPVQGLAASAAAAVGEVVGGGGEFAGVAARRRQDLRRSPGGTTSDPRRRGPSVGAAAHHGAAAEEAEAPLRRAPTSTPDLRGAAPATPPMLETSASQTLPTVSAARDDNHEPKAALQAELAEARQHFQRQRGLLVTALRRSARLEEELSSMRDNLTRKDIIIYTLRQDLQKQEQEAQYQQQQFELRQQQLQQQHQAQQLQQLQELQVLQHHQMQQAGVQTLDPANGVFPPPDCEVIYRGTADVLEGGGPAQYQVVRPAMPPEPH